MASGKHAAQFHNVDKLYGRDKQIGVLTDIFKKAAGGPPRILLVSGHSGIGKSVLIHEVYKRSGQQQDFFICGKFEQFNKDIPFSALIQALNELIHNLLTKSSNEQQLWRDLILHAVGRNGKIITDVIPALEQIIQVQPPVRELGPVENRNRFRLYFQRFIKVFTTSEHLFTIFLDDLQWADSASLNIIKTIIEDRTTTNLLFLGAYRDNEYENINPLLLTLYALEKENVPITTMNLQPLNQDEVTELTAGFLENPEDNLEELTGLIYTKTKGNPFFVIEFIKNLQKQNLLTFDTSPGPAEGRVSLPSKQSGWKWDIKKIKALGVTSNVAELLAEKVGRIPAETREILNTAACLGNRFFPAELVTVTGKSPGDIKNLLALLAEENFILVQGEKTYSFSHDKVQEAVYSSIDEEEKKKYHFRIGSLLLENCSKEEMDKKLFHITDQLNAAGDRVRTVEGATELAGLNLKAGKKAKSSTAYRTALHYLQKGMGLVRDRWWNEHYKLTVALYTEGAEAAYLTADFTLMENLARTVLEKSRDLLDTAKIYEIKINCYASRAMHMDAIRTGRRILKKLGVPIPDKLYKVHILFHIFKTRFLLKGKSTADLKKIPPAKDPYKLAAMRVLMIITSSAYYASVNLVGIITFTIFELALKYGNSPYAPFAYTGYGLILCGVQGDVETGFKFGELALETLCDFDSSELKSKVLFMNTTFIKHWKQHLKAILPSFLEGYQAGLESGDLEYACTCCQLYINYKNCTDSDLNILYDEAKKYLEIARQFKQEKSIGSISRNIQYILNLTGKNSKQRARLKGEYYDEDVMLPIYEKNNSLVDIKGLYNFHLSMNYLFGNYSKAVRIALKSQKMKYTLTGTIFIPLFNFYFSLAMLADYPACSKGKKRQYLKEVKVNQKKMKKWARYAPMNYLHKYYLVEAEKTRVLKQNIKAADLYEKAIELAGENEFINDQAACYECAGSFYLNQNNPEKAKEYIQKSKNCYTKWGALEKVKQLDEKYREL